MVKENTMKKIIVLLITICLILSFQVQPTVAKVRKASGFYYADVYAEKGTKELIKYADEYNREKALKIFNQNKRKFYKKYHSWYKIGKLGLVICNKLKGRRYTTWGTWYRIHNGKKKQYKYNKHVFKLAKGCHFYKLRYYNEGDPAKIIRVKKKKARKMLHNPPATITLYVRNGKVQNVYFGVYPDYTNY